MTAAGFIIFAIGESLVLSSSGFDLDANAFTFGSGTGLWAASLFVISLQKTYTLFIRITGLLAAVLFSMVAFHIFNGNHLNALTRPLPFYAYPVFVITIFGWAWFPLKQVRIHQLVMIKISLLKSSANYNWLFIINLNKEFRSIHGKTV